MMYKITGTVPTPVANKTLQFNHHISTKPTEKNQIIGDSGRTISVTTKSESVAKYIESVYKAVFIKVKVEKI